MKWNNTSRVKQILQCQKPFANTSTSAQSFMSSETLFLVSKCKIMTCSLAKSQIGYSEFCKYEGDVYNGTLTKIYGTLLVTLKVMANILMRKNMKVKMKIIQTTYWNNWFLSLFVNVNKKKACIIKATPFAYFGVFLVIF